MPVPVCRKKPSITSLTSRKSRIGSANFVTRRSKTFLEKPMPTHWATQGSREHRFRQNPLLPRAAARSRSVSWEEVPDDMKRTFERLGIPEQERKFLAGVEAQFDSRSGLFEHQESGRRTGRDLRRLDRGAEEASGDFPEVVRQGHPDGRQQVQRAELAPFSPAARSSTCRRA